MQKFSNDSAQKSFNCRQCGVVLDSQLFKRKILSNGNQSTIYFKRSIKDFVFKPKPCIPFLNNLKKGQNFQVHTGDKIIRWFQVAKGSCYCMTCYFQTKNISSFQKGSLSIICQKLLKEGQQLNHEQPLTKKIQVKQSSSSQIPSKYRCPKCYVSRLDNHRYGNVYMCRLCQQNWGQKPVVVSSVNGTKIVHQSKQSQYFTNPQKYRCPKCSCLRADNHRYGNVFMCRECQQNWGEKPVIVSGKYQPTKVVYEAPSYIAKNQHSITYTPYNTKVQEDISVYYNQHEFCPRCKSKNIRQNANLYSVFNCKECGQSWNTNNVISYGQQDDNNFEDDNYNNYQNNCDDYDDYDQDQDDQDYYYDNRGR